MVGFTNMVVRTGKLGLAAYILCNGGVLKEIRGNTFFIQSGRSIAQWRMLYYSSCCNEHDSKLVELRGMRYEQKTEIQCQS